MKEPEYYEKIGYEDHGYVSPELSSSDTYPDYIEEEVKSAVRRIQSHQGADTITFGFMTDIHYALSYNHEIRMKRTVNAYREIAKRVHIDRLMLGGDYTNEGCKEYKSDCYRELRAQLSGIDYFPVNGNHDDGTIWDRAYLKKDQAINDRTALNDKDSSDKDRKYMAVLNGIIKAFKDGKDFKYDCNDKIFEKHIDAKFSTYKKADVIGGFIGDYHTDAVDYDDGIPYILTANAVMYCTSESFYVQRSDGDKTELLFDIVTINKKERTIYVTRIGAGEDRVVKY